jgi:hypothetical protein
MILLSRRIMLAEVGAEHRRATGGTRIFVTARFVYAPKIAAPVGPAPLVTLVLRLMPENGG